MRTFLSYSCNCNCHGATEAPSLSPNLLILFNDPDDTESEEPMQYIFDETLRIASQGNNVHWIRGKPAMHTPKIPKGTTALRPNDLARIHLHYGFDALPSLVRKFCSKTLFVNALTCSALFLVALYKHRMCQSACAAWHGRKLDWLAALSRLPTTAFPSGCCTARTA
ncbi:hypothetical protein GPALN_011024 [Globodera pallida]|nr:hypothetical protein GPALN_011024 [Globodera pallida]